MSKFELSLAANYVPEWTIMDAAREFYQNALDQAATGKDNAWTSDYQPTTGTLKISNKESVLEAKTLLLGNTSKTNDNRTIGIHGEGYKIATLVALRCGKTVTFYNYGKKEIWRPRMVKSKRYGADILTFFTEKHIWQHVPDNNLTVCIEGITEEEWDKIVWSNLHLQKDIGKVIDTTLGRILKDEKQAGRIYVNGLFVKKEPELLCGYDIPPQYLKLDRDRKMISSFDLQWFTSKMWIASKDTSMVSMAKQNTGDARYVGSISWMDIAPEATTEAHKTFREENGDKAIPVCSQSELAAVQQKYQDATPVIVSQPYKYLIEQSSNYAIIAKPKQVITTEEKLLMWIAPIKDRLTEEEYNTFLELIGKLSEEGGEE